MLISISIIAIVILFSLDQLIKQAVVANLALGATHPLIPNVLSATYLRNDGAAWSMLAGQQWFFTVISIVALAIMLWFLIKYRHRWYYQVGLIFMIAGTLGNFYDRLINGYVVDMFQLDFINFPIFNFADTCLTIGVIWIIIVLFMEDRWEGKHA